MRPWIVGSQIEGSTEDLKPMKPGNSVEDKTSKTGKKARIWRNVPPYGKHSTKGGVNDQSETKLEHGLEALMGSLHWKKGMSLGVLTTMETLKWLI